MKIEHKFEYTWGGEDNWYTKSKRWANKQNPDCQTPCIRFYRMVVGQVVAGKVQMEMASVDQQVEDILEQWEEEESSSDWMDRKINELNIKTEPSEVEGLDNISISYNFDEPSSPLNDFNDVTWSIVISLIILLIGVVYYIYTIMKLAFEELEHGSDDTPSRKSCYNFRVIKINKGS